MGNDQLNQSLDDKIKQFESNVFDLLVAAFNLQTLLEGRANPSHRTNKVQRMAICAYHASGNLLATMFRHNFDSADKIKPPSAKNCYERQKRQKGKKT